MSQSFDWGTLGLLTAFGGCAWGYWHLSKRPKSEAQHYAAQDITRSRIAVANRPSARPANQLEIMGANELYAATKTRGLVERVRTTLGFLPENYERDVRPLIDAYAEYVQMLPASQAHHHAQPGGLLEHTLEVAVNALTLRQGMKLPQGASTEEQIAKSALWSYCVLLAAFLHDVGKPVADVDVLLIGQNPNDVRGRWNALAGSMSALAKAMGATHYIVNFPDSADYEKHKQLPLTLIHAIVPPSGLSWLGTDTEALESLKSYLDGNATSTGASVLNDIIKRSDSASVADNLKNGSRQRFASAKQSPLITRLMAGLQSVMAEGGFALNRPGAAAFVDGDSVWIVAGTCADKVRTWLQSNDSNKAGIPSDNTVLFDTWQEFGKLDKPPLEYGKGAVWWIEVTIDDWSHILTALRFKRDEVFVPGAQLPLSFTGSIRPVPPSTPRKRDTPTQDVDAVIDVATQANEKTNIEAILPSSLESQEFEANTISSLTESPPSFSFESFLSAEPRSETTQEANHAAIDHSSSILLEESPVEVEAENVSTVPSEPRAEPTEPIQAAPKLPKAPKPNMRKPNASPKVNAMRFMAWVQQGLGTGALIYNDSSAFVHFVEEGMILVSPKAFHEYLQENKFEGEIGTSKNVLAALQNEVQRSGYVQFNKAVQSHLFKYQTFSPEGAMGRLINCYLISNPQAYISPVPAPNHLLRKAEEEA